MTIIGVAGAIGSGKSFTQLKHGLNYVEERQKQLVTNFPINIKALYKYASMQKLGIIGAFVYELKKLKYAIHLNLHWAIPLIFRKKPKYPKTKPHLPWVKRLCESGGIIQIAFPEKIEALLIPESVVLLDEAGILLNSREFANTSKQLLADLAQSRKDGCDLIWCAQFDEQVDRQLRMLTQFWIHCESLAVYDKKMRRPKLLYKRIFWFRCSDYHEWQNNPRVRGNHFKTRFVFSTIYEGGLLSTLDKKIFEIFDSFKRLDKKHSGDRIETYWQCKLAKDYYFQRLICYVSERDPLSKKYQPLWGYYAREKPLKTQQVFNKLDEALSDMNSEGVVSKTELIAQALGVARKAKVKPPYFKNMSEQEIAAFIQKYV